MSQISTQSELVPVARREGASVIASLAGEIDLHSSTELRGVLLDMLLEPLPQQLILNLSAVPYMDSSALAVLVEAMQKLRKVGGKVILTNLQPRVRGLMEIVRLDTIFTILDDEKEAARS